MQCHCHTHASDVIKRVTTAWINNKKRYLLLLQHRCWCMTSLDRRVWLLRNTLEVLVAPTSVLKWTECESTVTSEVKYSYLREEHCRRPWWSSVRLYFSTPEHYFTSVFTSNINIVWFIVTETYHKEPYTGYKQSQFNTGAPLWHTWANTAIIVLLL